MNIIIKNISIKIASPNKIINWSYGEIKTSNFINYKTLKPEKNGLFCLKIFSIYNVCCEKKKCECYKHNKFLNLKKSHSSYRFGHLLLFYPVVHIWFLKTVSNNVSSVIDLTNKIIDKIINFKIKIVIKSFNKRFRKYSIILNKKKEIGVYFLSGAKAIDKLLSDNEILFDCKLIKNNILNCNSINKLFKYLNKINKIYIFYLSGNKPNWFCIKILPIVSPKIRPLIPLNTNKFATSDLNELYRKIINRNLRLKNIKLSGIPKQILINERILLQESVNALFDNEKIENPILTSSKRVLKSFSSSIKGKYGRFRQNLLGKRVDFSGRTVISVEPKLHLYQCGLPILIGLELFKPFIYFELKKKNIINNIGFIDDFYSKNKKLTIKILKKICSKKSILLNRAPTLHRMGIQSFKILLTQDKTIKLHPLVCLSYNADFDGDQMAIHLPLTTNAQNESNYLLLSINNIISPSNGEPIIIPTQDIVMGIYCLSFNYNYNSICFYHISEVLNYFYSNNINFIQNIILKSKHFFLKTTIGRIILYYSLFRKISIKFLNKLLKKKNLSYIIKYFFDFFGLKFTIKILDKLKKIGFFFSTLFGITISYYDLVSIKSNFCILKLIKKTKIENNIFEVVNTIEALFLILLLKKISPKKNSNNINNVFIMLDSGSRGSMLQIKQLMAFRGFFSKSNGDIIIEPILDNLRNGLSMRNYFISSFGARKGLTDTSLKTANSGYLTRKLVDVLQDVVIYKINCSTKTGILIDISKYKKIFLLYKKIHGRVLFSPIFFKNKLLIKKNTFIDNKIIFLIIKKNIKSLFVRSVIHCISSRGICSFCYGSDLSTTKIIQIGVPVGIIAAQSIGEPGTQLTMRTFHTGGVASITFSKSVLVTNNFGYVFFKKCKCLLTSKNELLILNNSSILIIENSIFKEIYKLSYGEKILVRNKTFIKKKIKIKDLENNFCIYAENIGYFYFNEILKKRFCESDQNYYYKTFKKTTFYIKNKNKIKKYFIPKDFFVIKEKFNFIVPGDIIAKMQFLFILKSSIIGGLPRLSELFEARVPKKKAILSDIDGVVKLTILNKNYNIIIMTKYGIYKQYFLENSRNLFINNGDHVKIGDILSDGKPDLNDIIKLIGLDYLILFFIKEINDIYQPQGIFINDKHIELVLKQMTKKVRILYSGECCFIQNDILYLEDVLTENINTLKFSKKISLYERIVFGITKVSLDSSSFFSAASFQETSKILIDSAIRNRVDYLLGLKENVVIGGLIPAGTGLTRHIILLKKNKNSLNNKKNLKFYIKNDFKPNN
ncbi:DNA-directed RNA polymerase subunit beta' [Candidatus Carsonella ruddii]|uniref:DNA-directed RNA polymerase subunit beta' n=1 Tax=Carsonella ruddii TaxID=114186 RepID=UPI003D3F849B